MGIDIQKNRDKIEEEKENRKELNMFLDDDDLGAILDSAKEKQTNFLEIVDEKTIMGRNMLLNYIGKMSNELQMLGYSDSSLEIVELYEMLKCKGKLSEFFSSGAIQFIKDNITSKPQLKNYLEERFFEPMEQEYREFLENTFEQNDILHEQVQGDIQEFQKKQILEQRQIKKIMQEKGCTEEQAKLILSQKKVQKGVQEIVEMLGLPMGLGFQMPTNTSTPTNSKTKKGNSKVQNTNSNTNSSSPTNFISFDDIEDTDNTGNDDTFF